MGKWFQWTLLVLVSAAYALAYQTGVVDYILTVDKSYLVLGMSGMLWLLLASLALMSFFGKSKPVFETATFINNRFTVFGLFGTCVGLFLATYQGIPGQEVMLVALGTSLLTTLAGIAANLVGDLALKNFGG